MPKTIYTYDPYVHLYLGTASADPDPLVKDSWLIPACATDIAPPELGERQAAAFDPGLAAWSVVADWRAVPLFETGTGQPYNPFDNLAGAPWIPVGPLPGWLTEQRPPSPDYIWSGTAWVLDEAKYVARLGAQAQAKAVELLTAANARTEGLADAYIAGQLSAAERSDFEAWAAYKKALFDVPKQAGYPQAVIWPDPPADAATSAAPVEPDTST
ncbi:putative Tail fiber assembly protein [Paraburkholderia tropica]